MERERFTLTPELVVQVLVDLQVLGCRLVCLMSVMVEEVDIIYMEQVRLTAEMWS